MDQETYSLWASIISGKPFGATMQINSYFSLGQLVAVVALIIAFIQLIKPIINFRLKAWRINTKRLIVIVSFSIISVFIAAILPFVPHIPLPVIGYPIFWEASSAVLLVLYATVIITKMLKTPIFNKKNAQSYFEGCYDLIAKGNQEILNELANEVRPSIEPLFDECGKFNPDLARQAEKQGDEYDVSIDIRIGYTLLDLFSDKLFCKAIITRAPKTAFAIFDSLKKRPTRKMGYSLSQELINQAFVNEDSILIREEKYSGLGIFKHFMLTVYGDWDFVNGLHGPLSAWRYYRNDNGVQQWQIKKYCECLAVSLDSYFNSKDYWQKPFAIRGALDHLSHIVLSQVANLEDLDEKELYDSREYKVISNIGEGIKELIDRVCRQKNMPSYDFDVKNYDLHEDPSIYGVIAQGAFEYLQMIASWKIPDWPMRHCAIDIWMKIFGVKSGTPSSQQNEIAKRLIVFLKKNVDDNLDSNKKWYPAITRLLISLNGFFYFDGHEDDRLESIFYNGLLDSIKQKYTALHDEDPEYAEKLIPYNVVYDKDNKTLEFSTPMRNKHTLHLN